MLDMSAYNEVTYDAVIFIDLQAFTYSNNKKFYMVCC